MKDLNSYDGQSSTVIQLFLAKNLVLKRKSINGYVIWITERQNMLMLVRTMTILTYDYKRLCTNSHVLSYRGVSLGGSDPGSRLLFCQIPVSRLNYERRQSSFFVISWVPQDLISRFHNTIIWLSRFTLTKNRQSCITLRPQWDPRWTIWSFINNNFNCFI